MKLLIASTADSDMRYAAGVSVPDSFFLLDTGKEKRILVSSLEFSRVKKEFNGIVELMDPYFKYKDMSGIAAAWLKKHNVKKVIMSRKAFAGIVDGLRKQRITVVLDELYPERVIKKKDEISLIFSVRNATVKAMRHCINIIKKSQIKDGYLYNNGKVTVEKLKFETRKILLQYGCDCAEIIISHGKQTALPHERGKGAIKEGEPIILDVFPQGEHGYWFDMTRTVVKGKPSTAYTRLWKTVKKAQLAALSKVKAGAMISSIHKEVETVFDKAGYKTGEEGFIHSTGHGVGLEIHEAPGIGGRSKGKLKEGMVITIEPGLYYKKIGGARIEDTVLVTKTGYKDLTRFPKVM